MNSRIIAGAVVLVCLSSSVSFTSSALAGGAFFSDAGSEPVNQAGQRIIFAQGDDGTVTQIVEIKYEGDAKRFSWVLPVFGTPVLSLSSVQALDRLDERSRPIYQVHASADGTCETLGDDALTGDGDAVATPEVRPVVTVIDAGAVGPFDFETIAIDDGTVDPGQVAVDWLVANGYEPGSMAREILSPYLESGLNLIGFKLTQGKGTDSIRPVAITYEANQLTLPIRPTAVAAKVDMPVIVWVLGSERAVPTNYPGLELNPLLIDWFEATETYDEIVTAAANEAGGHGFVTEYAGGSAAFVEAIAPVWEHEQLLYYSAMEDVESALISVTQDFGHFDGFLDAVAEHLTLRAGVTQLEFATCPYCYFYPGEARPNLGFGGATAMDVSKIGANDPIYKTDLAAFLEAVDEGVLTPIMDTAALFEDHDYVTRLYTTLSAEEMTKDPIFQFNPDLENVSNVHVASQVIDCDDESWVMTLPDGTKVYGDGTSWPYSLDQTDLPYNARVVKYTTNGKPDVIVDNRSAILDAHGSTEAGEAPVPYKKGICVYSEPTRNAVPWWVLIAGVLSTGLLLARRSPKTAPVRNKRFK